MAAADKLLFTDILECLTGVHQYLLQDLANERLSKQNTLKKSQYAQSINTLMQRIQSSHPAVRPRMNAPGSIPLVTQQRTVPSKPPPPIPTEDEEDEPQDTYEVPEMKESPEHYLSFEPTHSQQQPEEPQEEYLAMEGDEDRIPEETYEDPAQTMDNENQDLYEEAVPLSLDPPTNNTNSAPSINISSPPPSTSFEPAGYMDPTQLRPGQSAADNRASLVPEELIEDWDYAYEKSAAGKKKEKIKAANLKNIVTKGWLEKLGGRNHTSWQKRYCVLADVFLYFYEKESASTYNNRIPIPGFIPAPVPDLTRPKRNQYAFKLSCMSMKGVSKDYYFRAKTEGECKTWIEAIKISGNMGRGVLENKRKSMTLPAATRAPVNTNTMMPESIIPSIGQHIRSSSDSCIEEEFEQDNYEELEAAKTTVDDDQEEYVDVTPAGGQQDEPQEDYVDLQPTHTPFIEEEPQEDYVEAADVQPRLPPKPTSATPQLPLPPPPSSSNTPLAPKPLARTLPPRPDPVVDTNRVYEQNRNQIRYNNVFVILWDFVTGESDEISLQRGDLVHVADPKEGSEWWYGELLDQNASRKLGKCGLFPSAYSSSAFELVS